MAIMYRLLLLCGNLPGQMTLRDVGNFVSNHTGEFRLALSRKNGAGVDADETAKHRKSIDLPVANDKKVESAPRIGTGRN